jgi:hypothetical protein
MSVRTFIYVIGQQARSKQTAENEKRDVLIQRKASRFEIKLITVEDGFLTKIPETLTLKSSLLHSRLAIVG